MRRASGPRRKQLELCSWANSRDRCGPGRASFRLGFRWMAGHRQSPLGQGQRIGTACSRSPGLEREARTDRIKERAHAVAPGPVPISGTRRAPYRRRSARAWWCRSRRTTSGALGHAHETASRPPRDRPELDPAPLWAAKAFGGDLDPFPFQEADREGTVERADIGDPAQSPGAPEELGLEPGADGAAGQHGVDQEFHRMHAEPFRGPR